MREGEMAGIVTAGAVEGKAEATEAQIAAAVASAGFTGEVFAYEKIQ